MDGTDGGIARHSYQRCAMIGMVAKYFVLMGALDGFARSREKSERFSTGAISWIWSPDNKRTKSAKNQKPMAFLFLIAIAEAVNLE
jgi:hypothetical protein